jgi:threonine/homoserine/homoserine lactone efflux protein
MFLLLVTVLFFLGLVEELLRNPAIQAQALCLGLVLAALWWLYVQLPGFVRGGIRRVLKKGKGKGQDHGH